MKRREFITLLGGAAAAWPLPARAQHILKFYRLGLLANDPSIPNTPAGIALVDGLRENGFIEGQNIVIERRFATGSAERYIELATELVRLDVDVLITSSTPATLAANHATKIIPIVMLNVFDPLGAGLVNSLAKPGGNVTGLASHVSAEMAGKQLGLLKEAAPHISRVAVLMSLDVAGSPDEAQWTVLQRAARAIGIELYRALAHQGREYEEALARITSEHADALFVSFNGMNVTNRKAIIEFAATNHLPAMYPLTEMTLDGGLMSYGANRADLFRRSATYVAKILNGAKPADLPIEQPVKFEFVINLKTARALSLEISPSLLARADEVIE
jgi:putative ABC transport system substrate-binding protein